MRRRPEDPRTPFPSTPALDRDAIGRARTLTPEEFGEAAANLRDGAIRKLGFDLAAMNFRRRR